MSISAEATGIPRHPLTRASLSAGAVVLAVVVLAPVVWVLSLSLKTPRETLSPGMFPASPQFGNYPTAWVQFGLGQLFLNSGVITVASVALTIVAAMCAAYAFTKVRFRGSETLFSVLLLGVVVPPSALVVPLLIQMRYLGLYDTRLGLTLAYVAFGLPIATLVFRGFFVSIPHEIIEAARLDGCSENRILWRILAPLARGAIATVTILLFLANWNEFILALVLLRDNASFTLPLGINAQLGQYTSAYQLIAAASIIASLPIFAIYLALQGHFERGVTEGALKA
ncbi:MAG TPA: carbohydrate ABC transporter permease [Bauldia sp.]|nr:carbohydrate ABC transporter permease [Bauldia sp.]